MVRKLLFLLVLFSPCLGYAGPPDGDMVEKIERGFETIRTMAAGFRQTFYNKGMGEVEKSEGVVMLKKPMRMFWDYREPYAQTLICDGKRIYLYVPADRQVTVEKLGNIVNSRSPALFLAGNRRLDELFTIEDLAHGENKDKIPGLISLELRPKEKSMSVTRIVIRVDSEGYVIRSFSLFDWVGNRTDIEFFDMKINEEVGDDNFVFNRPEGVEEVEMPRLDFGVE